MSAIVAIFSILAFLVGQLLVTRRCCAGFFIWAGSNLLVATWELVAGESSTACLFATYCAANVYSLIVWSRS